MTGTSTPQASLGLRRSSRALNRTGSSQAAGAAEPILPPTGWGAPPPLAYSTACPGDIASPHSGAASAYAAPAPAPAPSRAAQADVLTLVSMHSARPSLAASGVTSGKKSSRAPAPAPLMLASVNTDGPTTSSTMPMPPLTAVSRTFTSSLLSPTKSDRHIGHDVAGQDRRTLGHGLPRGKKAGASGNRGKSRSGCDGRKRAVSSAKSRICAPGRCAHCGCDETEAKQWRSNRLDAVSEDEKLCSKCGIYAMTNGRRRPITLSSPIEASSKSERKPKATVLPSPVEHTGRQRSRTVSRTAARPVPRRASSAAMTQHAARAASRASAPSPPPSAPATRVRLPSLAEFPATYPAAIDTGLPSLQVSHYESSSPASSYLGTPLTPISEQSTGTGAARAQQGQGSSRFAGEMSRFEPHFWQHDDRYRIVHPPPASATSSTFLSLADICPLRLAGDHTLRSLAEISEAEQRARHFGLDSQSRWQAQSGPARHDAFQESQLDVYRPSRPVSRSPSMDLGRQRISVAGLIEVQPSSSSCAGADDNDEDVDMEADDYIKAEGGLIGKVDSVAVQALLGMRTSSAGSSPVSTSGPICPSGMNPPEYRLPDAHAAQRRQGFPSAVDVQRRTSSSSSSWSSSGSGRSKAHKLLNPEWRPSHFYNQPSQPARPVLPMLAPAHSMQALPSLASLFPRTPSGTDGARRSSAGSAIGRRH